MAYITSNDYEKVVYSGDSDNRIRIWFNDVELEDADYFCEKLTVSSRVLPNDASKRFSLDNFISKELTLILHNVDLTTIVDKVKISLGTMVNGAYEDVPLGIFNIQDTPTTDKNKITIKLRDNAVLFDFGYNAKPLIDENGGTATKLQLLQDMCSKAGVVCNITEFLDSETTVGIYDNTITARTYISYIAEQAGAIATINRDGELVFIYLKDLITKRIPLSIVEKYTVGEKFKISRVVFEDAVRNFGSGEETADTLFINAGNPYISNEIQITNILNLVLDFEIDSLTTGKILGNPSIDPYDIIEIYDDYVMEETVIARTLANHSLTYNGAITTNFNTEIGIEEKKENVSIKGEGTFKKWAKTEIDNVNAEIKITSGNLESFKSDVSDNYYNKGKVEELILNAENGLTNTFSEAGGNNILRNTGLWFENTGEEAQENPYEFWQGKAKQSKNNKSSNGNSIILQSGKFIQDQEVSNGKYSVSFYYQKLLPLATATVTINGNTYDLDSETLTQFYTGKIDNETGAYITMPVEVNANHITITFETDTNDSVELYDLMCNKGEVKLAYSQNQNETTTDTVNISKGITITSSVKEVKFKANADGIRTLDRNNNVLTEFTDKGMTTNEATIKNEATIVGILRQRVEDQIWDSFIG